MTALELLANWKERDRRHALNKRRLDEYTVAIVSTFRRNEVDLVPAAERSVAYDAWKRWTPPLVPLKP